MKQIWTFIGKAAAVAGVLLGIMAVAELARIIMFFYEIHPYAGAACCVVFMMLLIGAWIYLHLQLRGIPRVLEPPPLPPAEEATSRQLRAFARYLCRLLRRLARNPHIDEKGRLLARERAAELELDLQGHLSRERLVKLVDTTDRTVCDPLLKQLEEEASRHVRASVRDIMLAVTISPYRSIDLLVVLYRNATMVLDVIRIYRGRPGPREQWRMLGDTLKVVATVNVLNVGRNLIESLFSRLPLVGKVADDISQGLGAGFFTSLAGHAAMDRCAAYQGWSRDQAVTGVARKARLFLEDVRDLFLKDVLPEMKNRIRITTAEGEPGEESGLWDAISRGINGAVDSATGAIDQWILRPVRSGTQSVMGTGAAMMGEPRRRFRIFPRRKTRRGADE